jgi:thiol:disulfide interchange protein DsbA
MALNKFVSRLLSVAALGMAALLPLSVQAQGAFTTVTPVQPSDTPNKVEVLEFFAYACPHCATMEPMVDKWSKTLPENVVLRRVPVAFNAGMADLQRLYYVLESLDRLDLHPKVFNALHNERQRLFDSAAIGAWLAKQGIDKQQYEAAAKSFGVTSKVARAKELERAYDIQGTPTLGIGGKYTTSPSMTGTYEGTITQAQKLLDEVLKGQ